MSACEYVPGAELPIMGDPGSIDRVVGDALVTVHGIRPHAGGVDSRVTVDWPSPLPIVTDIVVLPSANKVDLEKLVVAKP